MGRDVPRSLDGTRRRVGALLAVLVVFDLLLVVWAFAFPDLWFQAFHGVERVDPQHLLQRMGANWAAFFLFQLIALLRWRAAPKWLLVVAGVRFSDIFTDITYVVLSEDTTWFAWATLPLMSLLNLAMGLWLLRAWHALTGDGRARPAGMEHGEGHR